MSKLLTERQDRILSFMTDYTADHGYPPSIREIGRNFGISSLRGVTVHLDALERKGYIKRQVGTSRGMTVLIGADGKSPGALRDAAPDLLDACREAHKFICRLQFGDSFADWFDAWHQAKEPLEKLRAAIRKANG